VKRGIEKESIQIPLTLVKVVMRDAKGQVKEVIGQRGKVREVIGQMIEIKEGASGEVEVGLNVDMAKGSMEKN
jgi:hypothetical protein